MNGSSSIPPRTDRAMVEQELQKVKHSSLIAARRGEYEKVAQLTLRMIQLSKLVSERALGGPEIDLTPQDRNSEHPEHN